MSRCAKVQTTFKHLLEADKVDPKYTDNKEAWDMILAEINSMLHAVKTSERGRRSVATIINPEDGKGYLKHINTSTKSTFPKFLRDILGSQGTTKRFEGIVKSKKGKYWNKLVLKAIERLEKGFKDANDYDTPNQEFINLVDHGAPF